MDSEIVCVFKKRYTHLNPLLFSRSVERAKDAVELFDILDTIPTASPLAWNATERRWMHCRLFQLPDLNIEGKDSDTC